MDEYKYSRVSAVLLIILLSYIVCYPPGIPKPIANYIANSNLLLLYSRMNVDYNVHLITTLMANSDMKHLEIEFARWNPNIWIIRTPLKFNARNWTMYLQFEDDYLIAKCIRYHDSSHWKPEEAPEDVIKNKLDQRLTIQW